MSYQTLTVDLTDKLSPDEDLAAMAEDGWRVHSVLFSDASTFSALMERGDSVPANQGRYQAPRQAVGPRTR